MSDYRDPIEQLRALVARANDGPPPVRAILTHHAVPYGRVYRQWDTRGDLYLWANQGEVADLPCVANYYGVDRARSTWGIPVVPAGSGRP